MENKLSKENNLNEKVEDTRKYDRKENQRKIIKIIIFCLIAALFVILTIKFYPFLYNLKNKKDRLLFVGQIQNMRFKGFMVLVGLQVLQIVIAILPGQPVEIISGIIYGVFGGVLICTIGILIGVTIVFYLSRTFGMDFVLLFMKKKDVEKVQSMDIFKDENKLLLFFAFVFLIPVLPKDIFVYIGGLTKIKPHKFIIVSTLARIPGQFLGVYIGSRIDKGNVMIPIIVLVASVLVSIIVYYVVNKKNKIMS